MRGTRWRRLGVAGVALTGGVAVSLFGLGTSSTTPLAAAAQELDPFDDCDELRDWYVAAATPKVGPWGFEQYPVMYAADAMAGVRADGTATAEVEAGAVGNGDTGTNVQEVGVDEPDIAKTNGEILVTIKDHALLVFDVSGAEPSEVGRLDLGRDMWGSELLLVGDRVVVMSGNAGFYGGPIIGGGMAVERIAAPGYWGQAGRATITTVDISDPSDPTTVSERTLRASLVSARQYGDVVRIVTSSTATFDFVYPRKGRSEAAARQQNREIIRSSEAEDWLPQNRAGDPTLACTDVSRPADSKPLTTVSILTLDPSDPDAGSSVGVAAEGDLVYSSTDRLYVSSTMWGGSWWSSISGSASSSTDVHAFALNGDQTTYVASGKVPGYVQDRWAFNEHEGELRVASTRDNGSESLVTVLSEEGDDLVRIGWVGGLGQDEEIKSVRWFGDVAVVVTFRSIDPLYTLDLSDPSDPRLLGELKIPGFSEYLHPIGDDLLLGVGQDAGRRGFTRGSQVQTFDLADLTSPEKVASLRFESDYSPVETDSRVFTYLPEQRFAFVPTGSWRGGGTVEVVRTEADGSLSSVASLRSGWPESVRMVPVADDRVAMVSHGEVARIIDVTQW